MALIYCPECKQKVSDSAKLCPHCGYDLQNNDFRLHEVKDVDNVEKQSAQKNTSVLKGIGRFAKKSVVRFALFFSSIFMLVGLIVIIVAGVSGGYAAIYGVGGIFLGIGAIGFVFNFISLKNIK